MRHRVNESVLIGILGLYNKPRAEVHPWHKLMGPKEEEEEEEEEEEGMVWSPENVEHYLLLP
jgi:hypothetical protein